MSKYKSKKITVNGVGYDSIKEYKRHCDLLLLERAGEITDLERQVKFVLIPAQYETYERYGKDGRRLKDGKRLLERECAYIADFTYKLDGYTHVEDVKGYKGGGAYAVFSIKRKLMLQVHGIPVEEV